MILRTRLKPYCILALSIALLYCSAGCAANSSSNTDQPIIFPLVPTVVDGQIGVWTISQVLNPLLFERAFDRYWIAHVFDYYGVRGNELALCELLEDGVQLPILMSTPPTGAGGRSSDVFSGQIYFATSDDSEPGTNGRTYTLECRQEAIFYNASFLLKDEHALFAINSNPLARQIPISQTWRNLDDTVSISPNIRLQGWPDLSSIPNMVNSIIRPGMTDEEKAIAIWKFVVDWRYHWFSFNFDYPDEFYDPVAAINIYGYGFCTGSAQIFAILCNYAGITSRRVGLDNHSVAEAWYNGGWHMFDADLGHYYLADSGEIADMQYIGEHPEIIQGTFPFPYNLTTLELKDMYAANPIGYIPAYELTKPHTIQPELASGMTVVFNYPYNAEFFKDTSCNSAYPPWNCNTSPPWVGNGRMVRKLDKQNTEFLKNIMIFEETWPYVILGADLKIKINEKSKNMRIYASQNRADWRELSFSRHGDEILCNADEWFESNALPVYKYWIGIIFEDLTSLEGLSFSGTLETTFQFAPRTMAHVGPGQTVFYSSIDFPDNAAVEAFMGMELELKWFTPIRVIPVAESGQ